MDSTAFPSWRRVWLGLCLGAVLLHPGHMSWAHDQDSPPAAAAASAPATASLSETPSRQPWQTMGLRVLALAVGGGVAWGLYRLATSCPRPRDE